MKVFSNLDWLVQLPPRNRFRQGNRCELFGISFYDFPREKRNGTVELQAVKLPGCCFQFLGGGFKYLLFSRLLGEDSHLD